MSSPVSKITDHVKQTIDRLLGQFRRRPVIPALVTALVTEAQRFEDVAFDFLTKILIDSAVGDILDRIGKIMSVDRLGRSDADFRKIIKVAIAARNSDGGEEQIVWIATQLVGVPVRYWQHGPANFTLEYESDDALSDDLQAEAIKLIGKAVSGGVQWRLHAGGSTSPGRFDESTFGAGRFGVRIGGS